MMDKSFGLILAVIALVAGIMLLTGHGDILLKGLVAEIIYIIVLIAILGWLVYYLKTKCAKK